MGKWGSEVVRKCGEIGEQEEVGKCPHKCAGRDTRPALRLGRVGEKKARRNWRESKPKMRTTAAGFEPTRTLCNGFQVHHLNHSVRQPPACGKIAVYLNTQKQRKPHFNKTLPRTGIEPVTLRSSVLRSPN